MRRTITLSGFAVALLAGGTAFAQPPSGYGTEGPGGDRLYGRARSTYERHWNADNEPKHRAENSARWVRHHRQGIPSPF